MQCRIQFHLDNVDRFEWCKLDETNGEIIESGVSNTDELTSVCADNAKILVFIAQQNILLSSPVLPPKANKQQLNAIAFNIEELLAEDIEDCFFAALAQQPDHTVPVAVINRDEMDICMKLLTSNHINARFVLPQIYLCPWTTDDDLLATICPVEGGYLIRTGQHDGVFCQKAILNQMVILLDKNKLPKQNRVVIYAEQVLVDFESSNLVLDHQSSIDLLARSIDISSAINLKQKDYQSSHQWFSLLKSWRWTIVAMILLAVVFSAGILLDGMKKERLYADIVSQQAAVINQYLPDLAVGNQPKKQLIKVLSESRGGKGSVGFLNLLYEYSKLKTEFPAIKTLKIQYQKSSLVVSLEASDLNSMESFRDRLEKSSFPAQIENVNINPDKTTGRLVMRGQ